MSSRSLARLAFVFGLLTSSSCAFSATRVPWTTSRILGTPEPPPPYVAERVLHTTRFIDATELDFVPGEKWALVLDRKGRMFGFDPVRPGDPRLIASFSNWEFGEVESYSIAFHPRFATNRQVFVALHERQRRPGWTLVARFELKFGNPPTLELASGKKIIDWESAGHNGCDLQFGPDGRLYISTGDGEVPAPPDPRKTGQDVSDLLGSILRIDVDQRDGDRAYRVPTDNPFVGRDGIRPEIWAYGFRNPWKMSFDPRDGALWVGDVGWELWEMLFRIDHGGFNGGWSIVEGPQSIHPQMKMGPTPIELPVISHPHTEATSITGGRLYRGTRLPELRDAYIYGDWGSGKLWALWWADGIITKHVELASTPHRIIGFAEDGEGELYFMNHGDGAVYRLVPNPNRDATRDFPRRLSETGLFASVAENQFMPGVYPFEIVAPMWSDHAIVQRAAAYPGLDPATEFKGVLTSPTNAVMIRTLSLEMTAGEPASAKRIETQLFHFDGHEWHPYTFRWNDEQTDAELVGRDGGERLIAVNDERAPGGVREQRWRFHSRSECARCHTVLYQEKHGNMNAWALPQLASLKHADGSSELDRLIDLGLIDESVRKKRPSTLVDPQANSATASLGERARSYLHANCAHCHRPGASGAVTMYWPIDFDQQRTEAIDVPPVRGDYGIAAARIVKPAEPAHSTLLYRLLTTGTGRMPIIGSSEVDEAGVQLIHDWIESMPVTTAKSVQSDTSQSTSGLMQLALATQQRGPALFGRAAQVVESATNQVASDLLGRFLLPEKRRKSLGAGFDPLAVLGLAGDATRGRELFFGAAGPQCFTCHQFGGEGRNFGPALDQLTGKYSRTQLLEQITKPNAIIDPVWKARSFETRDDESYTGFVEQTDEISIRLRIATGDVVILTTAQVKTDVVQPNSLMPEGMLDALTAQEAADLLEFILQPK